jgi:hypothetical protein
MTHCVGFVSLLICSLVVCFGPIIIVLSFQ